MHNIATKKTAIDVKNFENSSFSTIEVNTNDRDLSDKNLKAILNISQLSIVSIVFRTFHESQKRFYEITNKRYVLWSMSLVIWMLRITNFIEHEEIIIVDLFRHDTFKIYFESQIDRNRDESIDIQKEINFDETNEIIVIDKTNEINVIDKKSEISVIDKTNEVNAINETNEINAINETNEVNAINKTNEINAINETNEINAIDKMSEKKSFQKYDIDTNDDMNKKNRIVYEDVRKQLRKHTLQLAQIVIITISNANDYSFYSDFESNIIIVNEIIKFLKVDIWNILNNYAKKFLLLIDDDAQLHSIILSDSN